MSKDVYIKHESDGEHLYFTRGQAGWGTPSIKPEEFPAILHLIGERLAGTDVAEEIEAITGTIPGKVFYSADGEVIILGEDDQVISISPGEAGFNNGNPTTRHAYLIGVPLSAIGADQADFVGWATGWDA